VQGNGTDDGTPIEVYSNWNQPRDSNQNFDFITRLADTALPLINPNTGLCLGTTLSGQWHSQLAMQACDQSAGQQLLFNSTTRQLMVDGGLGLQCVTHYLDRTVWLQNCSAAAKDVRTWEQWNANPDGTISAQDGSGCLNISGDSYDPGATVIVYDCDARSHNERFTQISLTGISNQRSVRSLSAGDCVPDHPADTSTTTFAEAHAETVATALTGGFKSAKGNMISLTKVPVNGPSPGVSAGGGLVLLDVTLTSPVDSCVGFSDNTSSGWQYAWQTFKNIGKNLAWLGNSFSALAAEVNTDSHVAVIAPRPALTRSSFLTSAAPCICRPGCRCTSRSSFQCRPVRMPWSSPSR